MSAYDNVIVGKLKLKGKALDVKTGGIKKKKKQKKLYDEVSETKEDEKIETKEGANAESALTNVEENNNNESDKSTGKGKAPNFADHLTPAEKRYIEQREQLDVQKYSKMSKNSHRDRLDDFNQYLANLSEHYDIPKVGPG
ncbi:protein FAM32A-like [Chenopodium quinoa]|uniref:protein FAM32A-like n=1 Tax=Chenopodium quinoa TaxID=63459 RepID=UPI000B77C483|nr:protein FAM32A-like [Chenopodium quinoa]